MSVSLHTMQYLNQLGGLLTHVEINKEGHAEAFKLVPVTHWHNGQKFPHEIEKDLRAQSFKKTIIEGLEYYLIPESTTNSSGQVAYYAQTSQEGRVTPTVEDTEPPVAVQKYLKTENRKIKRIG